jgi:hypothetical protein
MVSWSKANCACCCSPVLSCLRWRRRRRCASPWTRTTRPSSYRNPDGKLEGYTVDLWRLWQKKTGQQVELIAVNWAAGPADAGTAKADVIDPIFLHPGRGSNASISRSPTPSVATSIYADASIGGIHDMRSLKGFEVGCRPATPAPSSCSAPASRPCASSHYEALVDAAASQDVKLLCMDEYSADYQLYRLGLQRSTSRPSRSPATSCGARCARAIPPPSPWSSAAWRRSRPPSAQALHDKWMGRPLPSDRYAERLSRPCWRWAAWCCCWWSGWPRCAAVRVRTGELERERRSCAPWSKAAPT